MKLVAIHQPNFFPWLGYFDKLARCHRMVLLDSVPFPRSSKGCWVNRVRLSTRGRPYWVIMPVVRTFSGTRLIREMEIDDSQPWRERLLKSLRLHYGRAPYFAEAFGHLEPLIRNPAGLVSVYNRQALNGLATRLGFPLEKLVLASSLEVEGKSNELLIGLVRAVGGDAYLSGGLAPLTYQDPKKFVDAGLELVLQDYQHPRYPQAGAPEFVPGLSVIDALMNCGWQGVRRLLGATPPGQQECNKSETNL